MAKQQTTKKIVSDINGNAVQIMVPVGSLDKPSEVSEIIYKAMLNPQGWKMPTTRFETANKSLAEDIGYCLNWYLGGHEMAEKTRDGMTIYIISSRGYYHYVGA